MDAISKADVIKNKNIYVYGAGDDGIKFVREHASECNIIGFIDNNEDKKGKKVVGFQVFSSDILINNVNDYLIIVATSLHWKEIVEDLRKKGIDKSNYFVWIDEENNNDIARFIDHNIKYWKSKNVKSTGKILVTYSYVHPFDLITRSVLTNVLADKYNAELLGCKWHFERMGYSIDKQWEVYQSFGVKEIIEECLNAKQKKLAEEITDKLFYTKMKRHDFRTIEVFGIDFSVEIIGDYERNVYPFIDIDDPSFKKHVYNMIQHIIFWHDYFNDNEDIMSVVLQDGIYREGIIRKFAVIHCIPVYSANIVGCRRLYFETTTSFQYYKIFFESMTEYEKIKGLKIGEELLKLRLSGEDWDVEGYKSVFSNKRNDRVLKKSDKIKVMIFHHYFEEDGFPYGDMIFDDQWDWLCHLGEWSRDTDYEWYLKMHIAGGSTSKTMINLFHSMYPNIIIIDSDVSPLQLKQEGLDFALTIYGSIGHEYPALGIQVIEAGHNPHEAFDFTWIPSDIQQYKNWIFNLEKLNKEIDLNEIYMFYYIQYSSYLLKERNMTREIYNNPKLTTEFIINNFSEALSIYIKEYTKERHQELLNYFNNLLIEMDTRKDFEFWRK